MALATIQLTQGAVVGGSGESVLGFDATTAITLTDDGGTGAISYLWEIVSWPGPDAAAPIITDPTDQVATLTPPGGGITDGIYIVRLTRNDAGDGVTIDVRFFGVEDADGLSLPVAGMNRTMSNVGGSAAAQEAGWFGRESGSTNVLLDAFLRLRRLREGRYVGPSLVVNHTSGVPVVTELIYGQVAPHQDVTLVGAGTLTHELSDTGAEPGAVFRYRIVFNAGAGNFILKDGVAGPTSLTLTAPPSGTVFYEVMAVRLATTWGLQSVTLVDPQALKRSEDFEAVASVVSTDQGTFQRIGTLRIDPSLFAAAQARFEASFETTDGTNAAEVRLYNLTDIGVVAGSTLSTTSTINVTQGATVTLPGTQKDYEVQLRLTTGDPAERASCTRVRVTLTWA